MVSTTANIPAAPEPLERALSTNIGIAALVIGLLVFGGAILDAAGVLTMPVVVMGGCSAALTVIGCVGEVVTVWLSQRAGRRRV